jgi:hypothetical protein
VLAATHPAAWSALGATSLAILFTAAYVAFIPVCGGSRGSEGGATDVLLDLALISLVVAGVAGLFTLARRRWIAALTTFVVGPLVLMVLPLVTICDRG